MPRNIPMIRRKLKQAQKVEKELGPLVGMLESLGKKLTLNERIKGESKQLGIILKRFQTWKSKHESGIPALEAELAEAEELERCAAVSEDELWQNAFAHLEAKEISTLHPEIPNLEYNFSGTPERKDVRYLDQFATLDQEIAKLDSEFVCLIDKASTRLAKPIDLPEKWQTANLILPRGITLTDQTPSPIRSIDELRKSALFPQQHPCVIVKTEWLKKQSRLFATFYHYAPWHLLLQALEEAPQHLIQLDLPSFVSSYAEPNLSSAHRIWLAENDPAQLQEIREANEEWDIFRHDLISRVTQAHLSFFQEQVTYLSAVSHTGIRR